MKNNGGKANPINQKTQQIKVNRKLINNNTNLNPVPSNSNYSQLYNKSQTKMASEEIKNIKYQAYLEHNSYGKINVFTESDALHKYPVQQTNIFKLSNLSPNDFKQIYNNTNGNLNQEKNLNLKNKNKVNNNEKKLFKNYTNREFGKVRKITSYKGNKKSNMLQKNGNSKENIDKNILNQKNAIPKGSKFHGGKNENQYPMSFINQSSTMTKYFSYNTSKNSNSNNNLTEENISGMINLNLATQKIPNRHEKLKRYNITSPISGYHTNNDKNRNKKVIRQNRSNLAFINRRKNNTIMSPESVNVNYISSMKTANSFSKSDNNTTNNYNSCYNFYQKNKLNKKKINNINMLNTVNNFGYLNSFNSMDGSSKKRNSLFDDNGENENVSSHINNSQQDFRKNENNNKINKNNNNNLIYNNKSESVNKGHKKGKYSVNALNLNNSNREFQLNKLFNNDYINYQRKIIEQFCHCLEEFIFINVKNNFDYFISQLKCYGKERRFSSLLLKRLQNKTIQKNFYKERASSYKYLDPNGTNSHYSSIIMMNNSNIINVQRKGDYIPGEMTKENYGRKTAYNFRNSRSPPLTEKMNRLQKNFRNGKSQEPLDINNIENYDFYNNNTYFQNNNILENYNNYNNYNASFGRNNYININVEDDDEERKSMIKYETNFNDNNNLYVPKKFKRMNNNNIRVSCINDETKYRINDSDILNPYMNIPKGNKIYSKKLSPENENNRSHDINNDMLRAKIKKNYYNINYLRKHNTNITNNFNINNYQDISCDTNSNYFISQDIDFANLNKTNDIIIKRNNIQLTSGNTYDNIVKDNKPIYKKKIKITQTKSKMYMNKAVTNNIRNKMIKLNTSSGNNTDHLLSPNFQKNNFNYNYNNSDVNDNYDKIITLNSYNMTHSKNLNNMRSAYTEPRREVNNNVKHLQQNKFGKIQELTVNLSKNENIFKNNNIKTNNENIDINNITNVNDYNPNDINYNGNNGEINDNKMVNEEVKESFKENNQLNDNNGNPVNNKMNENINGDNVNNNNNNEILTNNNNDYNNNSISNDNKNDDTDESDDNVTKEIIVKDVSTRDKRLNVFIKYVELSNYISLKHDPNKIRIFNCFQTNSIFIPPLFQTQKTNFYYNYYGNRFDKNNKLKLQKILSSIIEEEEKSKAAGSINNSYMSDDDISKNGSNYSHFYIQSIKYVSNFLQSIFDDKRRDMYFQFLKLLKKIKNESFLKGLINQKKFQTLNRLKDDGKENENNISGDVILYNAADNSNTDINYFCSKSIDRKDVNKNSNNKNSDNKTNKNTSEQKDNNESDSTPDKKFSSATNFYIISEDNLNLSLDKNTVRRSTSSYSFDFTNDLNEIDNKKIKQNINFSSLETNKKRKNKKLRRTDKNLKANNRLKQIIENVEEFKNWKLIEKMFKIWKNIKIEEDDIYYNDKKDDSDIHIEYEKNVTISEACRGLSDVILDFKIYLIKFCLNKKKKNNVK